MKKFLLTVIITFVASLQLWPRTLSLDELSALKEFRQIQIYSVDYDEEFEPVLEAVKVLVPESEEMASEFRTAGYVTLKTWLNVLEEIARLYESVDNAPVDEKLWIALNGIQTSGSMFETEATDRFDTLFQQTLDDAGLSEQGMEQWQLLRMLMTQHYERVFLQDEATIIVDRAKEYALNQQFQNSELQLYTLLIVMNSTYSTMSGSEQTKTENLLRQAIDRSLSSPVLKSDMNSYINYYRNSALLVADLGNSFYASKLLRLAQNPGFSPSERVSIYTSLIYYDAVPSGDNVRAYGYYKEAEKLFLEEIERRENLLTIDDIDFLNLGLSFCEVSELQSETGMPPWEYYTKTISGFDTDSPNGRRASLFFTSLCALQNNSLLEKLNEIISDNISPRLADETSERFKAEISVNLSKILQNKGEYGNAVAVLDDIDFSKIFPCQVTTLKAKAEAQKGVLLYYQLQYQQALGHFQSALDLYGQTDERAMSLGLITMMAYAYDNLALFEQEADCIKQYHALRPSYPVQEWLSPYDYEIARLEIGLLPEKDRIKRTREVKRHAERNGMVTEQAHLAETLAYYLQNDPSETDNCRAAFDEALMIYSYSELSPATLSFYRNYLSFVYSTGDYNAYNTIIHALIDLTKDTPYAYTPMFVSILCDGAKWAMGNEDYNNAVQYFMTMVYAVNHAQQMSNNDPLAGIDVYASALPMIITVVTRFRDEMRRTGDVLPVITEAINTIDNGIEDMSDLLIDYYPSDSRTADFLYNSYFFLLGEDENRAAGIMTRLKKHFPDYDTSEAELYAAMLKSDYGEAARIGEERLQRVSAYFESDENMNISNLTHLLQPLYTAYDKLGRYDDVMRLALWHFDRAKAFVEHNYVSMTEKQRTTLANNGVLTPVYIHCCLPFANTPENRRLAYDGSLFFKNLLLQSSANFRNAIFAAGDSAVGRYEEMLTLEGKISRIQSDISAGKYADDIDAQNEASKQLTDLLHRHDNIEIDLLYSAPRAESMSRSRKTDWRAVQKKLSANEAAIEFIITGDHFGALVLRNKGMKAPEFVPLITGDRLAELTAVLDGNRLPNAVKRLYNRGATVSNFHGKELYDSVWAPIEPYLDGVERIYYSPVGNLSVLAIHALENEDKKSLAELYDMRLVSKTGSIANPEKKRKGRDFNELTAFGDVTYDATPQASERNWHHLDGSIMEVNAIDSILSAKGIPTVRHLALDASEQNFSAMHGHSPECLLMSTHGFFCAESQINTPTYRNFLTNKKYLGRGAESTTSVSILPMQRAGLILADANPVWNDTDERPDNSDGIITAEEISLMDLSNTRLVVLSACETAKGEPSMTEGVTGLQRALKLAGAQSIVMTLWEVADNTSRMFMTEFFSNLANGDERHEAFRKAQLAIKAKYPREPFHWAPFVLLD